MQFARAFVLVAVSLLFSETTYAKPVDQDLQDVITTVLEEDYDNLANLWELTYAFYIANDESEETESPKQCRP